MTHNHLLMQKGCTEQLNTTQERCFRCIFMTDGVEGHRVRYGNPLTVKGTHDEALWVTHRASQWGSWCTADALTGVKPVLMTGFVHKFRWTCPKWHLMSRPPWGWSGGWLGTPKDVLWHIYGHIWFTRNYGTAIESSKAYRDLLGPNQGWQKRDFDWCGLTKIVWKFSNLLLAYISCQVSM